MKNPIIAISTGLIKSAIGIIRISFGDLNKKYIFKYINKIFNKNLKNRFATYVTIKNKKNEILDNGIAIFFEKPHTYTGENILEFHGHGNPLILNLILKNFLIIFKKYKIRLAKKGEFTKRAFNNKKLNLFQLENLLNKINLSNIEYLKKINSFTNFNFYKKIKVIINDLNKIKYLIEYKFNINYTKKTNINYNLFYIKFKIKKIINYFKLLKKKKINIIIFGYPNTGKSTLINNFKKKFSLISKFEGTTRDIVKTKLKFRNNNINIFDSVGIYKTVDKLENLGIKKTLNKFKYSNIIFNINYNNNFLYNNYYNFFKKNKKKNQILVVLYNKIDIYNFFYFLEIIKFKNFYKLYLNISGKKNFCLNLLKIEIFRIFKKINLKNEFLKSKFNYIKFLNKSYKHLKYCIFYNKINNKDILIEELNILNNILNNLIDNNNFNYFNKIFKKFCLGK